MAKCQHCGREHGWFACDCRLADKCSACKGSGKIGWYTCRTCNGTGKK